VAPYLIQHAKQQCYFAWGRGHGERMIAVERSVRQLVKSKAELVDNTLHPKDGICGDPLSLAACLIALNFGEVSSVLFNFFGPNLETPAHDDSPFPVVTMHYATEVVYLLEFIDHGPR
jgi:hypothetical protein